MKRILQGLRQYHANLWYMLDLVLNTLIGGDPRETISSRMGRSIQKGNCSLCRYVCWLLDKLDPDHCARATNSALGDRDVWR